MRGRFAAGALLLVACGTSAEARDDAPVTRAEVTGRSGSPTVVLRTTDRSGRGIARTDYRVDGGPWHAYEAPRVPILDRSPAAFARWSHVGQGSFERQPDGSVRTRGGLGMLWFDDRDLGDVALHLQWRDDTGGSNGGVLVRFPDPVAKISPTRLLTPSPCQARLLPVWIAVTCGHEVQVNDGSADPQQTGSVYNFASLAKPASRPAPAGTWNDFEIRLQGAGSYRVVVLRNDALVNDWVNHPGQQAHREGDPPTDARQYARGHVGLQNHGPADVISYRDVSVRDLRPEAAAFVVRGKGTHQVQFRSRDWAGNAEPVRTVVVSVR